MLPQSRQVIVPDQGVGIESRQYLGTLPVQTFQRQVESELARQTDTAGFERQLQPLAGRVDPGQIRQIGCLFRQFPQGPMVILLIAGGSIRPVIDHHDQQKLVKQRSRIGLQAVKGGEQAVAFRQGRDNHRALKIATRITFQSPRTSKAFFFQIALH